MRIVHITPAGGFGRLQLGGAERAVLELASESARRGHLVEVVAPAEFLQQFDSIPGLKLTASNVRFRDTFRIARRLRRAAPDVVVVHLLRGVAVGGIARWLTGPSVPLVSNLHNSLEQTFTDAGASAWRRAAIRMMLRGIHADRRSATVAISPSNRADLLRFDGFSAASATLIENWVNPSFIPLSDDCRRAVREGVGWRVSSEARAVLFAGRLESQKDPCTAVRLVAELGEGFSLAFAGAGTLQSRVETAAREAGVRAVFLGHVANVEALMAASDLVIVPSVYEGFGRVAIESLSTGTPVVASDARGLRDALSDFDPSVVRIHRREDTKGWVEAMLALSRSRSESSRWQTHRAVQERFGFDAAVDSYLEIYSGLRSKRE